MTVPAQREGLLRTARLWAASRPPGPGALEVSLDPVSQAVGGASAAQVFLTDRLGKQAFACGALGERFVRDFARCAWFADGFVARDPADPAVLADMR